MKINLIVFFVALLLIIMNLTSINAQTRTNRPQIINDGTVYSTPQSSQEGTDLIKDNYYNEPENTNPSLGNYQINPSEKDKFSPENNNSDNLLMETYKNNNPIEQLKSEIKRNNWINENDNHEYDSYSNDNIDGEGEDDGSYVPERDELPFSSW